MFLIWFISFHVLRKLYYGKKILVDSIYRRNKSYFYQAILGEIKYMVKNETTKRFITKNVFDSDSYFNCNSDYGR